MKTGHWRRVKCRHEKFSPTDTGGFVFCWNYREYRCLPGIGDRGSGQTSITGGNLAYKSLGTQSTTLSATGYLGTYLTIPAGGATVNFDVNANATSASSPAHMEVVVDNSTFNFNVSGTSATNYDYAERHIAGRHLFRSCRARL